MLHAQIAGAAETFPDSAYRFDPRIEANARTSRERTSVLTDVWYPIAQQNDRLIYGSVRYMGDNMQNFEGNLGFGYRHLAFAKTSSRYLFPMVLGTHVWLDRRHTTHNSTFYQTVIGIELLSDKYDARLNVYEPLSGTRTFRTENFGSTIPYLAGQGLYKDVNGTALEEAQSGYDFELGYRLPVFEKHIDSFRVYNGVYSFHGDVTDSVTGWRGRIAANITPSFTIGARVQYDAIRGTQSFADLTLRFPFSSKKPFDKNDLRSRLDESPERDIDIVTNNILVDDGLMKPVINPDTGTQQRILHVDNRYASNGDGSLEMPYHSLASVQDIMKPNDIIYVHHGDGTSSFMDTGLVISQPNIQLIGSGAHLVHANGRIFSVLADPAQPSPHFSGDIIVKANQTAVIGNNAMDNAFGHGLVIAADNVSVSGIRISESYRNGIHILADGTEVKNIMIDQVSSMYNYGSGIGIEAINGGSISNVFIRDSHFDNNIMSGMDMMTGGTSSRISNLDIQNNTFSRNHQNGWNSNLYDGSIDRLSMNKNIFDNNQADGFSMNLFGTSAASIDFSGNGITRSKFRGLAVHAFDMSEVNFSISENTIAHTANDLGVTSFGLSIDNDTDSGVFNVDLGGGALQSAGYNRIYDNGDYELFLDTRPGDGMTSRQGQIISANYNYWGTTYGLDTTNRIMLDNNIFSNHYSYINSAYYLSY